MAKLGLLALAGALGTCCRVGLAYLVQSLAGRSFPWDILVVNVLGCFLFGFLWPVAEGLLVMHTDARFYILAGFMGAFTTFSSFAFDTVIMMERGEWFGAMVYIAASNLLGIAALIGGLALGRAW
jgi:CrcB protein